MRCRSCGEEIEPDHTLCTYCGAPVKTSGPPPAEISSPGEVTPSGSHPLPFPDPDSTVQFFARLSAKIREKKPQPTKGVLITIAVTAIVILAAVYGISIPVLKGAPKADSPAPAGNAIPAMTTVVPTPATRPAPVPVTSPTPMPVLTYDPRYGGTYVQVYTSEKTYLKDERVVFPYALNTPPLDIRFTITAFALNETVITGIGTGTEAEEYTLHPDPSAWFEILVRNTDTNTIVEQRRIIFGERDDIMTDQEIMIRSYGNYKIVMSGNKVNASVTMWGGVS